LGWLRQGSLSRPIIQHLLNPFVPLATLDLAHLLLQFGMPFLHFFDLSNNIFAVSLENAHEEW